MIKIGGRGTGKSFDIKDNIFRDYLEKENKELIEIIGYWHNRVIVTESKLQEKTNEINDLNNVIKRLCNDKKELVNSIENLKMKYDTSFKASNFKDYRIDILKSYISDLENQVKELKYLNNFFSIVIKENFVGEDTVIKQYLDKKLNLLIDQNAPECLKTLIQNLIDELNNN